MGDVKYYLTPRLLTGHKSEYLLIMQAFHSVLVCGKPFQMLTGTEILSQSQCLNYAYEDDDGSLMEEDTRRIAVCAL